MFRTLFLIVLISFITHYITFGKSDTLIVNMKDGTEKIIAIDSIQKIGFESITEVDESYLNENDVYIVGNQPNPASGRTNIIFNINEPGSVYIKIFNQKGVMIRELGCIDCPSGKNIISWDCRNLNGESVSPGTYYYELRYGRVVQSKKMIILK